MATESSFVSKVFPAKKKKKMPLQFALETGGFSPGDITSLLLLKSRHNTLSANYFIWKACNHWRRFIFNNPCFQTPRKIVNIYSWMFKNINLRKITKVQFASLPHWVLVYVVILVNLFSFLLTELAVFDILLYISHKKRKDRFVWPCLHRQSCYGSKIIKQVFGKWIDVHIELLKPLLLGRLLILHVGQILWFSFFKCHPSFHFAS